MYWADKIVKEIISSNKHQPFWVDDMKTPSGLAHIGSLRGPLIHSVIYRVLKDAGVKATYTFVFNDFDPADELPPEFREKYAKYLGFPLKKVPSPVKEFSNMADYLADDLRSTLKDLGVEADFLSSWEMYQEGKFDKVIKEALDAAEKIQDIYHEVSGSAKKEKGWLPFQVICPKCGKLGTTRVFAWDGKEVSFKCEPSMVSWAQGCGHEGKISPFGGTGKLPWKVDWAAHWKVIGITIEGAGKDHGSAGGSYDIAMALSDEVFHYPRPYKMVYEWLIVGGKKMSSSKGIGTRAHDATKIFPAEVARFLFTRSDYREAVEFDPENSLIIPDIFDEFDRCYQAYIDGSNEDLARAFTLSQIKKVPEKKAIFIPRFREVAQIIQMGNTNPKEYFAGKKGSELTGDEEKILKERIKYAQTWLDSYAPDDAKFAFTKTLPKEAKKLTDKQKEYLMALSDKVEKTSGAEDLEKEIYSLSQTIKMDVKDAFGAIYLSLIGKNHGPKAAWLIMGIGKEKVIKRFKEIR
jgi:lysyl-tRNA synthetase class 1